METHLNFIFQSPKKLKLIKPFCLHQTNFVTGQKKNTQTTDIFLSSKLRANKTDQRHLDSLTLTN